MKPFTSPLSSKRSTKDLRENAKKARTSAFQSPLQRSNIENEVPATTRDPHTSTLGAADKQTGSSQARVLQDRQVLIKAAPERLIRGPLKSAAADAHAVLTGGLKPFKAFKAPSKVQHALQGKEDKASAQAHSDCKQTAEFQNGEAAAADATYYTCIYSATSSKKKKNPSQDGVLQVAGTKCCLYSEEGKVISKTTASGCIDMPDGATLAIGTFQLEVCGRVPASAFLDGSCFLKVTMVPGGGGKGAHTFKPLASKPFKNKMSADKEAKVASQSGGSVCRYPLDETSTILDKQEIDGTTYTVIIDPFLVRKLRPHQKEGVLFMYRCVMGLQSPASSGCLLADEMGLGKTLQTLTLIWSLLKQGPLGKPAIRRAIVVCPSSLVENWANEVKKWLGQERLRALAIHAGITGAEAKAKFDDFINGSVWPLLITSYELARKYSAKIAEAKCGLLVCDEAHRLKNSAGNKTIEALLSLQCARRVLLSGTPLQNNLSEFFAMMSFIAPDLLGNLPTFKRLYADPIERSRDRTATREEKLLGEARSAELKKRTQMFVLRRTSDVNAKYLPPRTEYVVFCKLQPVQIDLYQALLHSQLVLPLLLSSTAAAPQSVLASIGLLRKLCNHPHLLLPAGARGSAEDKEVDKLDRLAVTNVPQEVQTILAAIPNDPAASAELSGKLAALMSILEKVAEHNNRTGDRDKVVIVSEWTATLDVIQEQCEERLWDCLRLDGSTAVADRQSMVNRFNGFGTETIFLLSKKAGGCGLNLIGAHRLVLFDSDWNPANDKQAMARIWRDGQTKPVVIYRLLSRGSIEEKIYQRQIAKDEVAAEVTGASTTKKKAANQRHFSKEELRELFTLRTDTSCDTRDLVRASLLPGTTAWQDASPQVTDAPLKAAIAAGHTTFVYEQLDQTALEEGQATEACADPVTEVSKEPFKTAESHKEALQSAQVDVHSLARDRSGKERRAKRRRKVVIVSESDTEDLNDRDSLFEPDEGSD